MATPAETAYHQSQGEDGRIKGLVLDNLALVNKIADRLAARLGPEVSREELISAGMLGLVEAAHRFDETHNVKFTTFAYRRVRGAMLDLLRQRDWLGRSAREHLDELRDITRRLRSERGRSPTIEELAAAAGLSEEDTLRYLSYERWDAVYSLDQEGPNGEGRQPADLVAADVNTPLDELEHKERIELLGEAIEQLPERLQEIIVMYYYEDLYMAEMAEVLGVSESRISQLHTRALYDLMRILEE